MATKKRTASSARESTREGASGGKSWQARIGEGSHDAVAEAFVSSLDVDHRLLPYDIAGSIAHATMLAEVGLITKGDRKAIEKGLNGILADYENGSLAMDASLEDIHMVVEAALIERVGEPGRRLHTGRSRNDQVALDLRLWMADHGRRLVAAIGALQRALLEAAEANMDAVLPAYTHLQQAQPICAAAHFLAFVPALQRAADAMTQLVLPAAAESPLGSGAVAGTTLPIDRERAAELLRDSLGAHETPPRSPISINSIDASATRDIASSYVFACSQTMIALSRLAEDWIILMSQEFGYLSIGDVYTTGSSMMPQKRNPDMLELIRGKSALLVGHLTQMMTLQKGLPTAYNRDLQDDKRVLFTAHDETLASVTIAARMARTARINPAAVEAQADKGFMDATALSEYLVDCGVPFRTSHQVVGRLVRLCLRGDSDASGSPGVQPLRALPLSAIREACTAAGVEAKVVRKISDEVYDWLGVANVVRRYRSAGSGSVASCQSQIDYWKSELPSE